MPIVRWTTASKDLPLSVLADNYIRYLVANGRSPHSIANAKRVMDRFQRFLLDEGEQGIRDDLCVEAVRAYKARLIADGLALSSVRTHVQVLKAWAARLTEDGIFATDPLMRRDLLPRVPKRLPRVLSEGERDALLRGLDGPGATAARDRAIVCLLLDTGIRVSECATIMVRDVDMRRFEVVVTGKGNKQRKVGFGRTTARHLRTYIEYYRRRVADDVVSQGRLFLAHGGHGRDGRSTIGEPLTAHGVQQVIKRLAARTGVDVSCHTCRHTWATDFAKSGAGSVSDLQNLLGHESPTMALYYVHVANPDSVERQKQASLVDRGRRRTG